MALLTIIIPSFNSVKLLCECINSIKNQTFSDYEVIVVDAQSTDGTIEFLKTLKAPFYWVSEPDKGIYDAMNKGINKSNGNWVYFLGCDDKLYDNNVLKNIFNSPIEQEVELIIGRILYEYKMTDSYFVKRKMGYFKPSWNFKLWIKHTVHHQGRMYNRSLFSNLRYNISYKILSDYDLNLKLFNRGVKTKIVDALMALTKSEGVSKHYTWSLFLEEIDFKTKQSSLVFKPIFYVIGFLKFFVKRILKM
jgi:glycosyltransferase involved in cell wall biosynthesis